MTIFDIDCPDWASVNEHGLWCNACGYQIAAAHPTIMTR